MPCYYPKKILLLSFFLFICLAAFSCFLPGRDKGKVKKTQEIKAIQGLAGSFSAYLNWRGERNRIQGSVVINYPGQLRMEFYGFFMEPRLLYLYNQGNYLLFFPQHQCVSREKIVAENYLPFVAPLDEIISLLLLRWDYFTSKQGVGIERDDKKKDNIWLSSVRKKDEKWLALFKDGRLKKMKYHSPWLDYQVEYKKYMTIKGFSLASQIIYQAKTAQGEKVKIKIRFKQIDLDPSAEIVNRALRTEEFKNVTSCPSPTSTLE